MNEEGGGRGKVGKEGGGRECVRRMNEEGREKEGEKGG